MSASNIKASTRARRAAKRRGVPAALLVAISVAVSLAGCRYRGRRTPDDTLVVVVPNLIRAVDPRFSLTNYDTKLSRLVFVGLTTVDTPSLEPKLALAESIEPVSDLSWEVSLRPDARFSDGSPVTAADVAWTFESTMNEKTGSLYLKSFRERFDRFEVLGTRRLRIHLVKPVATLLSDLDFGVVKRPAAGTRPAPEKLLGAGPFRLVSYSQEKTVLERNPHYFGPAPATERLEVLTVRDTGARALMLVGGSADLEQNAIRPDLVAEIARHDKVRITTGKSAILTYLMMQTEDPVLSDVRVRRAIACAIDRDRIVAAKFGGLAVPATGLLPPMHWAYEPDVARYRYDPDRARKLLDEAGYPDPDGPGGQPRLRLTYKTSADQFRVALVRILAAQLAEVGIEVEVRSFEFGTFFADIKRGNFQLASMQTSPISEPDMLYAFFHSSQIPTEEHPHTHNRWRYRNPRVDQLTERGRVEMDRGRRREIYSEVQKILARDLPIIPLWHEHNVAVMNRDVEGYDIFPNARLAALARAHKTHR